MIEIKDVQKSFGELEVLKGINMTLEDGKIYGLIGESGSGKSTLLRCINGLTDYNAGSIQVNGVEVADLKDMEARRFRQNIGMIFQNYSLLKRLNVYDNVALPMRCWKYSKDEIRTRVTELLEMVQIPDKINVFPDALSGGQKQRVAIARALTMNPQILLCDEATSALDPNIADTIMELLVEINKKLGITIILVTHQLEIVKKYCDKVYVLEKGSIAVEGECDKVFYAPPKALQRLMGVKNNQSAVEAKKTIHFALYKSQMNGEILTQMAIETGINYSIVKADWQEYCNDSVFQTIIQVDDDQFLRIADWLTAHHINWRTEEEGL